MIVHEERTCGPPAERFNAKIPCAGEEIENGKAGQRAETAQQDAEKGLLDPIGCGADTVTFWCRQLSTAGTATYDSHDSFTMVSARRLALPLA
jgi:hypothetical protein